MKYSIRYIRFRSSNDGGRLFDFSVSGASGPSFLTCFEIPASFFAGNDRIRVQEGAGICYAKLKDLLEVTPVADVPGEVCLTAMDLAQYRPVTQSGSRR